MTNPPNGMSIGLKEDDLRVWTVLLNGPEQTPWEGGFFPAELAFPNNFPNSPPVMRFTTPNFFHPNIYKDGKVCISILHEPVHDPTNTQVSHDNIVTLSFFLRKEKMSEKWR